MGSAFFTSAPPMQPGPVPYVTTSGIAVAEIAYVRRVGDGLRAEPGIEREMVF